MPLNCRASRLARFLGSVVAGGLLALVMAGNVGGQPAARGANSDGTTPGLRVHRIYVPADAPTKWPTNGETYLPIDAAELAELLAAANGDHGEPPYVASSLLHATLRPDGVLAGTGLMRIEMLGGEEEWLALPSTDAHLAGAEWLAPTAEAQVGYRGLAEGIGLRVTRPGRLSFGWELGPQEATSDFELRWPSSSVTTLVLDLPPDVRCEVAPNSGMLVLEQSDAELPSAEEWPTELWPPPLAGTKRWLLTSPPSGVLTWQLRRNTPVLEANGPKAECHEEVTFEVAENGTRVFHRLHFTGDSQPTAPPVWKIPQELVITSARWGSRELTWTRDPTSDVVVFELADAGTAAPQPEGSIEIEAWGATALDEEWRLPTLEPQGVSWLYGRATVQIAPELEVRDLMGSNVRQSSGTATDIPTRLVFEKLRGNGAIMLKLARRADPPSIRVGRWIELDGVTARARMWVVFEPDARQPVRHVQALVEEGWNIQTVVARVPYDRDDWYAPAVNSPGPRRLTVRVSASPNAGDNAPMVLEIGARRTAPGTRFAEHTILTIEGARVVEDFVTFAATEPYRLEYPENLPSVPNEKLSHVLGVLLPETVSGPVFDMRGVASQGAIRLGQPPAAFDAHVTLQLEEEQTSQWRRTGLVRIVPQEGLVDRLALEFAGSLKQPIRWRLDNESEWHELETAPSASEEQEKAQGLLLLPQPTSTPLTVYFDMGDVAADRWVVEPIRVVNAQSSSMLCEFRTADPARLGVEGGGFSLVAPQDVAMSDGLPLHSRWRLDAESSQASLVVARRDVVAIPSRAQVALAQLNSEYAPGTMSRHLYHMTIVNHGETRLTCELPALAENVRAWRGETPTEPIHPKTTQFELPLLGGEGKVVYHVAYSLPAERLESGDRLAAPWPKLNLPVVSSAWVCEVPHDLRLITPVPRETVRSWQQRLLGILGLGDVPWLLESDVPRWQSVRIPAPAQLPLEIRIVSTTDRTTQCLWLIAASLMAAHFCVKRWPAATVMVAGVAAATSVLLSGAWSFYGAAVSVGMWFGIFVTALSLVALRATRPQSGRRGAHLATTSMVVLLAVGLSFAAAAPAQDHGARAEPKLEAMLIPVDSEGREVGERHYVTPRLLRELTQRREAREARGAWILTSGITEGELSLASEGGGLVPGIWTLTYEVETFRQDVAVELPLVESQGVWNATALADGISLPLVWNPGGHGCRIQVAEPGVYIVRVTTTPRRDTQGGKGFVKLDVPPLPDSELRLTVPTTATGIDVNGRPLPATTETQRSRVVRLPMEGKIVVRWPQPEVGPVLTDLQATELTWMEVGEDAIEVQSVFHIRSTGLLPATLELQTSEPARLVTDDGTSSMVGPVEERWTLEVEPLEGLPSEGEVRVHLRLARDHVLGRIPYPQSELSATNIVERKFAGSSTESLALALDVDTPAALAIDPLEFSYDWPERLPPVIAVKQMESEAGPVIAVRPARDEASPEEVVEVGCFDESFRIEYEGVTPRSIQDRWQQSLRVTPELVIDNVVMTVGTQRTPLPVRVSRPQPDKLVVFFSTPIQGSTRLAISAHLPRTDDASDTRPLPTITSYTNPASMQRMELFSGHRWQVDLVSTDVRPLNENPAVSSAGWDAYPVGTYQLATQRGAPLEVTFSPNRPATTLRTVTSMAPSSTGWVAEVKGVVEVEGGMLWELPLEMPESFLLKAETDSPVLLVVAPSGAGGRRVGTLRWGKVATAGDRLKFTLRGPVRPNRRQQFEIPSLRAVGTTRVDRLLAIPPAMKSQVGSWENLGPRVAERPAWLDGVVELPAETELYRVPRGGRGGPRLVSREPASARMATAALMETQFWFAPQQGGILRTTVALPSLEEEELLIEVPTGQRLLWLAMDRRAVVVEPRAEGYAVRLPAGRRPHGLEVVTRLDNEVPTIGAATIAAPRLLVAGRELAVAQRLWSYDESAGLAVATATGGEALSELDQSAVRLNQLLATLIDEANGAAIVPEGADVVWFEYWTAVLDHARQGLERAMERSNTTSDAVVSDQPTNAEFQVLLTRAASHLADLQAAAPPRIGEVAPGDPWLGTGDVGTQHLWRPLAAPPQANEVLLHLAGESRGVSREQWLAAAGLLAVAGVLALMTRQRRPLWQHDQVLLGLVLLAGGAWWLWLPLGWIGLLMAIGAGVAWLRYLRGAGVTK